MSYQVLARKWRPKSFHTLVGQEHVLKALINALDSDRLHHAYLFTGTRGVGKTTISRILAKCLNCETGVSSTPCGQCSACVAIDEGRFVDLIEVDAASRTKVEDTRELLDNVQYRPTAGRYKVYLIDEVHMLSNHSFNALLKTLEEPPPHVKFLLATTDPQKLPVTILSRCLKFHLKNLTPERIEGHLAHVLGQEGLDFEASALRLLAKSAQGSMRDALSLLDQAIAHGQGRVEDGQVREMLGVIDRDHVYRIVDALAAGEGEALLAAVARCAEFSPDFEGVLNELLSLLHRVAVAQAVPDLDLAVFDDGEAVARYASLLSPEDVQLYYQIGLHGRRDLPLAPDAREGLEMSLLRMLAYRPEEGGEPPPPRRERVPEQGPASVSVPRPAPVSAPAAVSAAAPLPVERSRPAEPAPVLESPASFFAEPAAPVAAGQGARAAIAQARAAMHAAPLSAPAASTQVQPRVQPEAEPVRPNSPPRLSLVETPAPLKPEAVAVAEAKPVPAPDEGVQEAARAGQWWAIVESLGLAGPAEQLALNTALVEHKPGECRLALDATGQAFNTSARIDKLAEALTAYFGQPTKLVISELPVADETPAQRRRRIEAERLAAATESLARDEILARLKSGFHAELVEGSIRAL
ncbi:MAG: DNA polymerase III subunit gamma/tau [Gammaproteobacteria bacterium]|nr:DNA polymerase III subunit gamma/tau [Gammaproteobacteria bacterium]